MTNVSATIKDPAGNLYTNALVIASFVGQNTTPGAGPYLGGGLPTGQFELIVPGETDSFGSFTMPLMGNDIIQPAPSQWKFSVVSSTVPTVSFAVLITITGATQDITAALQAAAAPLVPNTSFTNVGVISFSELANTPPGITAFDNIWGNGAKTFPHRIMVNMNNAGATPIAVFSDGLGVFAPTTSAQLAAVISDESGTGPLVFATGSVIAPASQNGLATVYADQFASVQAAINALPTAGGCVDARSPNCNLALGTIDPGSKMVTLLLGPNNYTADHIVLQANFRVLGSASVGFTTGTTITSVGANGQPLIVNLTSGLLNIRGPEFRDMTLIGLSGNTSQDGMKLDLSANTSPSVIDHFSMWKVNFSGFKGNSIYIKGPNTNNGAFNQFFEFHHVTANRPAGAGNSLRITGASGQMDFYSCQFDGNAKGNGTNIYIGTEANADTVLPYSINFYSLTSQASNIDFNGSGFNQVGFFNTHQENTNIVYQLDSLHTNSKNGNVVFSGGYFANAGINAGAGRILKVTTNQAFGVVLEKNTITGVPDRLVESTTGAEVVTHDNNFPQNTTNANITTSIDFQTNPAATLGLGMYHTVMLQASATSITTINSQLGPGEFITFFANGICQFATGGNITLVGSQSLLILYAGDTATFVNSDYTGTNTWRLVGTSSGTLNGATAVQLTAQGANIGTTTAFAVPATSSRGYRVHIYEIVTRAATTSSTLPTVNIGWTDKNNSTAQTLAVTPGTPTGNSLTTVNFGTFLINALASTNITYSTTAFASVGGTTMQYALLITVEPI